MKLVSARSEDESEIKRLLSESALNIEDIDSSHLENFIVAREDEEIIGVVGVELMGEFGLIRSLAVRDAHRGKGYARELLRGVENHALARGVRQLFLLTTTAAGFLEHNQYERTERNTAPEAVQQTSEFARLCPDTAICMTRKLIER